MLSGFVLFGPDIQGFHTISGSFETTFRGVIGQLPDWDQLATSNYLIGPPFIILFSVFVVITLLNMYIAILNKAYNTVSSRPQDQIFVGLNAMLSPLEVVLPFLKKFKKNKGKPLMATNENGEEIQMITLSTNNTRIGSGDGAPSSSSKNNNNLENDEQAILTEIQVLVARLAELQRSRASPNMS